MRIPRSRRKPGHRLSARVRAERRARWVESEVLRRLPKTCSETPRRRIRDQASGEHSKKNRDRRQKAAEDDGRVYRPMDRLQPCMYLDRAGKRGPHCLREFTPKTGGQIYCDNCRPLARRDRQAKAALQLYRDLKAQREAGEASPGYEKRLQWGRTSAANYQERQRKLATQGKILAAAASMNPLRQKIAMALLIDRSSGNEQVKQLVLKLTGESVSTSTVERVRAEMGLARKKGRPAQNL
jgi:hypothetical protein